MRDFHDPKPQPVSGRMALGIQHKDGTTERVDLGVVKEGFVAPTPGDTVEHNGVRYEVTGAAATPQSEVSVHVVAEAK